MGDLHDSYPLTKPLSFTLAKDVEATDPTPVVAPNSGLSPAKQATGRHWSAKVVLVAGLDPARAFAADAKSFQVRKMLQVCCPDIQVAWDPVNTIFEASAASRSMRHGMQHTLKIARRLRRNSLQHMCDALPAVSICSTPPKRCSS